MAALIPRRGFWLGVGTLFFLHEHAFWGGDRPVWPAIVWETLVQDSDRQEVALRDELQLLRPYLSAPSPQP